MATHIAERWRIEDQNRFAEAGSLCGNAWTLGERPVSSTVTSKIESEAPPIATVEPPPLGRRNDTMAAIFWVTISVALFAVLAAGSRKAIDLGYDPLQVVFLRNASALLLLLPLLAWRGAGLLHSRAIKLYGVRVVISLFSMTAWFCALALIPMGQITAIGFLSPLFGALGAIVFLGEKVRARRWTALIVGFIGAMIMLRPGTGSFGLGQLLAVSSAAAGGLISVLLKRLVTEDDPDKIVFLTTAMMAPLSLLPALFVWKTPGLDLLLPMLVVAVSGVLGHLALMRGFRAADASLVLTFEFSRLPFVVAIGYWMFGELIDRWTWVGAAIILASAVYITHREAKVRRQGRA